MSRFRVTARGSDGDLQREYEADYLVFPSPGWCVLTNRGDTVVETDDGKTITRTPAYGEVVAYDKKTTRRVYQMESVVVAAFSAESLLCIERIGS